MTDRLSGRRVLVVEDEVLVSWVLEDMLADFGCTIVGPVARLSQALVLAEAEFLDLAVLDINLNGQKSYPVADALAARGVPFIFSSGYSKDTLPNVYRDCPMLQKPYSQSDLGNMLAGLLTSKEPDL